MQSSNDSRRNFLKKAGLAFSSSLISPVFPALAAEDTSRYLDDAVAEKGAVVKVINGYPELFIDGQKASRMWARLALPGDYGPEKLEMYAPAGIQVYFTSLDTAISLCWNGAEEFYFDKYEAHLRRLVEQKPDIRLILYVGAAGGAPYKWCKAHEEELTQFDTGQRLEAASIASKIWWEDSARAFAAFVKYFSNSRYAQNIIGFNPIYNANEWFSHHRKSGGKFGWADFSKPMQERLRDWLRARYAGDERALRESWNDPNVTFETASVPSKEQRLYAEDPSFFYTLTPLGNRIADYYLCYDETLAELGIHWCKTIKQSSDIPRLAGMMYGYSYCGRHDSNLYPHHHGHGTAMLAMQSEWVDFMHSPYHYYNRSINGTHYSQHAVDTVTLHGKLMVDQIDSKPHLRGGSNQNASTPWESEQLLKRDVSYSLTKNFHAYWLEGGPGNMFPIVRHSPEAWGPFWFDDPALLDTIGQLKKLVDQNQGENNASVTEMAIFTSNEGLYHRRMEKVFGNLYVEAFRQWFMPKVGIPFDDYILEALPLVEKSYKVYVFMDAHYVPPKMRAVIKAKLEADGATAIWFYAPGYLDGKTGSLKHIEALTGMKMGKIDKQDFIQVEVTGNSHPFLKGVKQGESFGTDMDPGFFTKDIRWMPWPKNTGDYKFTPIFYVNDRSATSLGQLRGYGHTGFAVKDMGQYRSVYVSAPLLQPEIIRNIAESAGVHVYNRDHALIYANNRYVSVTAAQDGQQEVFLPAPAKVADALTGEAVAAKAQRIAFKAKAYETRIFRLEEA